MTSSGHFKLNRFPVSFLTSLILVLNVGRTKPLRTFLKPPQKKRKAPRDHLTSDLALGPLTAEPLKVPPTHRSCPTCSFS